jgi:hypothetical protein
MPMATGHIKFVYDAKHDVHIAYPDWSIETEADCKVWVQQYVDYCEPLRKPVDMIMVLDNFSIGPKIGSIWGRYRADFVKQYTRYSVRVHAAARVDVFIATSAALHNASADEAADVPTALRFIEVQRARGGR